MADERTRQAVYNNALWCFTVCRAHGSPGEFQGTMWLNRRAGPRFYPNAQTLVPQGEAKQLAALWSLIADGPPGEWAVKDSYAVLDLHPLGFRPLFEAEWIWRDAAPEEPTEEMDGVQWGRITTPADFQAWEVAWSGESAEEYAQQSRIFLPSLLDYESIAFIAAYQDKRIVAGAIASRTGSVVGISNIFLPQDETLRFRAACVAQVARAFPGLPIVGYESDQDLAEMQVLGFQSVGPLRIWLRSSD